MFSTLIPLVQSTTSTTVAKSSSSGSSYVPLLVIIVIFVAVYLLFLRPRQQRMRQQQTQARQLSVGDEVMSAGGIYGRVVALDADSVEVEVSPGVVMTFTRRAISIRPQTAAPTPPPEPVDEPWTQGPGDDVPSYPPTEDGPPEPPAPPRSAGG